MTDKDIIRTKAVIRDEIERLHEAYRGQKGDAEIRRALRTALYVLDSMTVKNGDVIGKELREEISKAFLDEYMNDGTVEMRFFARIAKHFVKWHKEQVNKVLKLQHVYQNGIELGVKKGKSVQLESMMKKAVDGVVSIDIYSFQDEPTSVIISEEIAAQLDVQEGDNVKVIIVKE